MEILGSPGARNSRLRCDKRLTEPEKKQDLKAKGLDDRRKPAFPVVANEGGDMAVGACRCRAISLCSFCVSGMQKQETKNVRKV